MNDTSSALVLFSGGQDFHHLPGLGAFPLRARRDDRICLGQRHAVEMDVREPVRRRIAGLSADWNRRLGPDRVVSLDVLGQVSLSALTADLPMGTRPDGLPSTFVPGAKPRLPDLRRHRGLTARPEARRRRGLRDRLSGYPDCRDDTVKALQVAINLGMEARLVLETPLMWIDKADTWRLADQLGGRRWSISSSRRPTPATLATARTATTGAWAAAPAMPADLRAGGWTRYRA